MPTAAPALLRKALRSTSTAPLLVLVRPRRNYLSLVLVNAGSDLSDNVATEDVVLHPLIDRRKKDVCKSPHVLSEGDPPLVQEGLHATQHLTLEAGPAVLTVDPDTELFVYLTDLDIPTRDGKNNIADHENDLLNYARTTLSGIEGFIPVGNARRQVSVISFNLNGFHPFDVGMMLDAKGIAVRTGHHCTQPLMDLLNIEGTVRASMAVYNTREEIDTLAQGISDIISKVR